MKRRKQNKCGKNERIKKIVAVVVQVAQGDAVKKCGIESKSERESASAGEVRKLEAM